MDKLLETKFRLKGARNPLPPATGTTSAPTALGGNVQAEMTPSNCLPQIAQSSPMHHQTASTHKSESTYAASGRSRGSQGGKKRDGNDTDSTFAPSYDSQEEKKAKKGKDDSRRGVPQNTRLGEKQPEAGGTNTTLSQDSAAPERAEEPPHVKKPCTTSKDLPPEHEQKNSLDSAAEETEAVAWYIEPGGQVLAVDIPSGLWPRSRRGSPCQTQKDEEQNEEGRDGEEPRGRGDPQGLERGSGC